MPCRYSRRKFLMGTAAAISTPLLTRAAQAPAAPVAVARCRTYTSGELLPVMSRMFDQLGGLERLVKGKTVAMKINLTGSPTYRVGYLPAEDTHYTHPQVIAAAAHLMGRAGAKRVRVLESPWSTADAVEEYILQAGWEPRDITGAAPNVEFENTNYLGRAKKYSRMKVPFGGYMFPAFDLNHSYEDCDVFVSIAKMKEHATAGVTLSMKNCFGITPCTIYGDGAGVDEPSIVPRGGRGPIHSGYRLPAKSAPAPLNWTATTNDHVRVPRTVVDLVAARPIHLAIVEGIRTMTGGEGPWIEEELRGVAPGVIVAGLNPVCTDAVSMSLMGFDPRAEMGTPPFEVCESIVKLAEDAGLGTRDLKRIEVVGGSIAELKFDFAAIRALRRKSPRPAPVLRG